VAGCLFPVAEAVCALALRRHGNWQPATGNVLRGSATLAIMRTSMNALRYVYAIFT
jgi:hypothetical protein